MYMSFTNKPLEKLDQTVYFPPLPHITPALQVCLPTDWNVEAMRIRKRLSIGSFIAAIWNSTNNGSNSWIGSRVLVGTKMKTFAGWEKLTKENPRFITKIKWPYEAKLSLIPQSQASIAGIANPSPDHCAVRLNQIAHFDL